MWEYDKRRYKDRSIGIFNDQLVSLEAPDLFSIQADIGIGTPEIS